jgi:hypothetical protein
MSADVRRRRAEAARKYQPDPVRLLLIAEAPPAATDRYFYSQMYGSTIRCSGTWPAASWAQSRREPGRQPCWLI